MSTQIFSALRACSRTSFADAGKEIATTLFASLLPIWLGLAFTAVMSKKGASSALIVDFLSSNEALLVSAALVGPLIYTISRKYGNFPRSLSFTFPYGLLFLLIAFCVCVVAAGMFGLTTAGPNYKKLLDPNSVVWMSAISLIVSVITLFFVSALRNQLDNGAPQKMSEDTEKFIREWRQ